MKEPTYPDKIVYTTGDVTTPQRINEDSLVIIAHCCNNLGVMGAGVALAIRRKWPIVFREYELWSKGEPMSQFGTIIKYYASGFILGSTQFVPVAPNLAVANIIGQEGVGPDSDGKPPIRYEAIESGFNLLSVYARRYQNVEIHMPKLGCGLAGGSWDEIEPLIYTEIIAWGIPVVVYDF